MWKQLKPASPSMVQAQTYHRHFVKFISIFQKNTQRKLRLEVCFEGPCAALLLRSKLLDIALTFSAFPIMGGLYSQPPPSTTIVCPLMYDAAGDAINTAAMAQSQALPSLPSGTVASFSLERLGAILAIPEKTKNSKLYSAPLQFLTLKVNTFKLYLECQKLPPGQSH